MNTTQLLGNLYSIITSDVKYAIRLLAKTPRFTLLSVSVMAVGIGLSIYLFSLLHTLVYKPLPFKDSDSLVVISEFSSGNKRKDDPLNLHDYYEIRKQIKGLSEFSAYRGASVNISERNGGKRYQAVFAEPNIFKLTRAQTHIGREFNERDNQASSERVVVISYDLWQNHFLGDAHVLDHMLRINGMNHRVIGVMPAGYQFPNAYDLWLPMQESATQLSRGSAKEYYGLAHLEKGVSKKQINQRLTVIMKRIEERYPETNAGVSAFVDSLQMTNLNSPKALIHSMYIVAVLILILASINVGNLLLSRTVERGKETAMRVALGAPRLRLVSQMLWESVIICSLGGVIGLLLVAWGLEVTEPILVSASLSKPPFWWQFGLDGFTLKIFLLFVIGTILVTGLLPAWKNSNTDFNSVLRDGTRGALGRKAGRLNRILVISEVCISIAILITASTMTITTYIETHRDIGASTDNIITAKVPLSESRYDTPEKKIRFLSELQSRLENSVGIHSTMIVSDLPGTGASELMMMLEGREYHQQTDYPWVNQISITPGSLAKLGIKLTRGRYFNSGDIGLGKTSVIVTEEFASRHFPSGSVIGKRFRLLDSKSDQSEWLSIVGVVGRVMEGAWHPHVFTPFSEVSENKVIVAMQVDSNSAVAISTLRATLHALDPAIAAYNVETYADMLVRDRTELVFVSTVFLLFAIAAVILAATGIYGVMSNTITQRTQEIGVKRALGAQDQKITYQFLIVGLKQFLWGALPGLIAGYAMAFSVSHEIFGKVDTGLPIIATTITSVIGAVVIYASYVPTRRALTMEPSDALRYE